MRDEVPRQPALQLHKELNTCALKHSWSWRWALRKSAMLACNPGVSYRSPPRCQVGGHRPSSTPGSSPGKSQHLITHLPSRLIAPYICFPLSRSWLCTLKTQCMAASSEGHQQNELVLGVAWGCLATPCTYQGCFLPLEAKSKVLSINSQLP